MPSPTSTIEVDEIVRSGNLYKEVWPTWNDFSGELTAAKLAQGLRTNEDENPSFANVSEKSIATLRIFRSSAFILFLKYLIL